MEKTESYAFDVIRTKRIVQNWEQISCRIGEICGQHDKYLHLDSIEELTNGATKKIVLHFFYITKVDRKEKTLEEDISELSEIFGCKISLIAINPKNMKDFFKGLQTAKTLMTKKQNEHIRGDEEFLLNILTPAEIEAQLDEFVGFNEFKDYFRSLSSYIDAMKRLGKRGNYNTVIVNSCGANDLFFIDMIFALLAAKGVLIDQRMIRGDLDDAARTVQNTAYMYNIQQRWHFAGDSGLWFGVPEEDAFRMIERRRNVYITTMDKEQYEKAKELDYFRTAFTHVAEIKDLSEQEKIILLSKEAKEYGFAFDEKSFQKSSVLKLPYSSLKAQMLSAVQKQLSDRENKQFLLTASDFDESVKKCECTSDAMQQLESLIGLQSVKQCIREITALLKNRGRDALPCLHMVFRGNPGTGKTTVARLIGKLFGEIGVIKDSNKFIETDRNGLVSQYLGGTASKTDRVVKDALGGVLFIDEAYALAGGSGYDYGGEALATLVKRMEDYRNDFVCIMAGYTKEMDAMININPGLRDRIQFYIDFPDYSEEELFEIFDKNASSEKYILSEKAAEAAKQAFSEISKYKDDNFSNGRLVRKIFERVRIKQSVRAADNIIEAADIQSVFAESDMSLLIHRKNNCSIGFHCEA